MTSIPPKNYLTTIDNFLSHWALVNAASGATPLVLSGAYALATLTADRAALAAQMTLVETATVNAVGASNDRDLKRANLQERMRQFNSTTRGLLAGTIYPKILPGVPSFSAAPGLWTRAMDDMASVWNRINTDTPAPAITVPLTLTGPYTRANYVTDQTALLASFTARNNAATTAESARDQRDVLFNAVYARLTQYRKVIQGRYPKTHQLYQSLPVLRAAPGHTPAPVNVSAVWEPLNGKARITYDNSKDPDLANYQLRATIGGTKYDTSSETVLATNPPDILFFTTDEGLVAPGSVIFVKVYVILSSGNEKGSKSVKIVRG